MASSKSMLPITKQCFVVLGVFMSTIESAFVMSFTSVMVPQLKLTKEVELDEESESWIASIVGMALIVGIVMVPLLMNKLGRRTTNFIANFLLALTWFGIAFAPDVKTLLAVRFFQGLSLGMMTILGPVLIGEYSSPKYRGAFLTTIALSISSGVLILHGLAVFFNWRQIAFFFIGEAVLDCIIILCSPESPSFLAASGRYDECKAAFRWLRGPDEDSELEKLIKLHKTDIKILRNNGLMDQIRLKLTYISKMVVKKEFYKPVIIMFHLHIINEWSGANVIDAYTSTVFTTVISKDVNVSLMMISTDVLRLVSNMIAMIVIKKVRRRVMLLGSISLNIASFLLTAAYVFAKSHGVVAEYPLIGKALVYLYVFTISTGNLPLPNIIAGEIFALEYKGTSGMVTMLFFCVNLIINMKIALFLFSHIGLHGAYCLYAGLVTYGLLVSWLMLPETKDRTLLDIEEEFKGKKREDLEHVVPEFNLELKNLVS